MGFMLGIWNSPSGDENIQNSCVHSEMMGNYLVFFAQTALGFWLRCSSCAFPPFLCGADLGYPQSPASHDHYLLLGCASRFAVFYVLSYVKKNAYCPSNNLLGSHSP